MQKDSALLLKTKIALENTPKGWRYFLLVCKLCLIQRIGNFAFYKLSLQDIIQHFEYAYYVQSIATAKETLTCDTKQLPNVIDSTMSKQIQELTTHYKIPSHYDYMQHSFLSSVCSVLPNAPRVLLKEHYRCHPKIINFCNQKFYGNHARGHYNQREIDIIINEILPHTTIEPQEIGIITPYNEQKAHLQNVVGEIEADTVHKYQGREKDLIIIATTNNQSNEFIDNSKMLNVAITRAKKQLKLIVSYDVCHKQNTNINDFIRYITYQSAKPIESKVYSIFDLLYKANTQARELYLKCKRRISQFDSENIAFAFIKDILQQDSYHSLDVLPHIPLAKVIKIDEALTQEEKLYAQNPLTHFDFIIYHIMDKVPLLAVEIDGYAFHHTHKQLNRDRLKDSICKKHNFPLLRLSTTQSAESKRLKDMLQALL